METGEAENVTEEKEQENDNSLNLIMDTKVMKVCCNTNDTRQH